MALFVLVTKGRNSLQEQARFDDFVEVFNHPRPHEALDMRCPAEVYQASPPRYRGLPTSTILSTTKPSWSPAAAAFVWATNKSISARSSPGRPSASRKFTTISGSSVLWIMIWVTSTWRLESWNRWKTHWPKSVTHVTGTFCNPCLRVAPRLDGRPEWIRTIDLFRVKEALWTN